MNYLSDSKVYAANCLTVQDVSAPPHRALLVRQFRGHRGVEVCPVPTGRCVGVMIETELICDSFGRTLYALLTLTSRFWIYCEHNSCSSSVFCCVGISC